MIADGTYGMLVRIHADMSHNMHNMGTIVSMLRFLPWHRAYLLRMEDELVKKEPDRLHSLLALGGWRSAVPGSTGFKPTVDGVANKQEQPDQGDHRRRANDLAARPHQLHRFHQ